MHGEPLPATEKQLAYLRKSGVTYPLDITLSDASDLIEKTIKDNYLSMADLMRFDPKAPTGGKVEIRFCCPLPGLCASKPVDRYHRNLCVNTLTGKFECKVCQAKGKLTDFWEDRPKLSSAAASQAEARRRFALPERKAPAAKPETPEEIEKAKQWREAWETSADLAGTPGADYIEGRSIPLELAIGAGVKYSPEWAEGANPGPAVLFPVRDRAGDLVAVAARYIDGRKDSKRTAGQKSAGVFCAMPDTLEARCLAICEGQFDALALSACGIPAIALIGVSWPEWLPRALAFRNVLLATDADKAGDEAAAKLGPELSSRGAHTLRLRPKTAKDWGEAIEGGKLEFLSMHLRGFSGMLPPMIDEDLGADDKPKTADEVRGYAAREMAKEGRIDAAMFITRLIDDLEWKVTMDRKVEGLFNEANTKARVNS